MSHASIRCDLLVIGSGLAGMAAALFAARRGLSVVQVGVAGEINFASGLLDLMGVYPVASARWREDPWAAIADLGRSDTGHPYQRIAPNEIAGAVDAFTAFLAENDLPYAGETDRNTCLFTPAGTLKHTYRLPRTMAPGAVALARARPCRIVGFERFKGFSARQIQETLTPHWPHLSHTTIPFPGVSGELYPEQAATALEQADTQSALIAALAPLAADGAAIGLPAILGLDRSAAVVVRLSRELGCDIFEIPTLPPSVPGIRLRRLFQQRLPEMGVEGFYQNRILAVEPADGRFRCEMGHFEMERVIRARGVVLCTGRFFGRGLHATRTCIRETLLDLPVRQPAARTLWHRERFLDREGHTINLAGLETDDAFRPLGKNGKPAFENLHAAGTILAGQDWCRMKCGAGLSIATAHAAVSAFARRQGGAPEADARVGGGEA